MDKTAILDRSERLTETGIGLLRIAAGMFFLAPGLFNVVAPGDFLVLLEHFPPMTRDYIDGLFVAATTIEVVGGLLLVLGWNARLVLLPLIAVHVVAGILVVRFDTQSDIRLLSLFAHIMGIGLYTALLFLGSGRWSLDGGRDVVSRIAAAGRGGLARITHAMVSGAGRNFGVFLIRASVALPFIAAFFLYTADAAFQRSLPDPAIVALPLFAASLLGGLALLAGFQLNGTGWFLAALTVVHLVFVGLPDSFASQIGFINLLFHGLIFAAVICLRLIRFGSDLEVEHILSLDKKTVVVVGGGFAGTSLAKRLERKLPQNWRVVMISEENYTTFNPMLAEIVGATIMPSHCIAPIRRMLRRTRFIMARVSAVDLDQRTVRFDSDGAKGQIGYDHLVLAFGSRANLAIIPGMQEHAYPFKLLGDALTLRNRVIEQLERAEIETLPDQRRWLGHFVVIGGGFSGVEVAGAIHDFIASSHKHYPQLHDRDLQVSIVHGTDLPIPELAKPLGLHAKTSMTARGIQMYLDCKVERVDERGVEIGDGRRLDAGTIICTIGTKPNALVQDLDIPKDRGRIVVDGTMAVQGHPGLWALGDCAIVPNGFDGRPAAPTAQFAVREGKWLADNINAVIRGDMPRPFAYKPKGSMATIGHLNGVADLGFMRLTGFPAWIVWRGFYLSLMPTVAKKVKIFFEWTWSMLFSADIVDLRFTRTADVDRARTEDSPRKAA